MKRTEESLGFQGRIPLMMFFFLKLEKVGVLRNKND